MAITAIANIGNSTLIGDPTVIPPAPPYINYAVPFTCSVTDGTALTTITGNTAFVPFANFKKVDRSVREAIAAAILSSTGFVIDPDDIYIPFA